MTNGFPFLPYQAYVGKIYADTVGKAYTSDGTTLEQGFAQWQERLIEYGKQQGYAVQ